jgi:hypothetical protein
MRTMKKATCALLFVAACGGGGVDPAPDAPVVVDPPDAMVPDPDAAPPTNVVELWTFGAEYVRYRNGDGPWVEPVEIDDDTWALGVTDDYQVIAGCDNDDGFDATLMSATYDDGDLQFIFCSSRSTGEAPETFAVTTQMLQAGTVQMYDWVDSEKAPWDVTLNVPAGVYDLAAFTTDRIELRRDLEITAAQTLPDIDVVTDGVAMTATPLTINGAGDADLLPEVDLYTANGYAFIPGEGTTAQIPPASLLEGDDFMYLYVSAYDVNGYRTADVELTGAAPPTLNLMPALTGLTYTENDGVLELGWGALPDYDDLSLSIDGGTGSLRVTASKRWIDATGADHLAFDAMPSDWNAAWTIDLSYPYGSYVRASDVAAGVYYSTTAFNAPDKAARPAPTRAPRKIDAQRLRASRR